MALHRCLSQSGTRRFDAHQVSTSHVHGVRRGALRRLRIAQHRLPVRPIVVAVRLAALSMQLRKVVTRNSKVGSAIATAVDAPARASAALMMFGSLWTGVKSPDSVPRGRCSGEDGRKLAGSDGTEAGRSAAEQTAGNAPVRRLLTLQWGGFSGRGDRAGTRLQGSYGCRGDQEPAEEPPRPCPGHWHS